MSDSKGKSDKELAVELTLAYLNKTEVRLRDAEPDKIADYFDVIHQKIKNI
jgi:hypothetical protein